MRSWQPLDTSKFFRMALNTSENLDRYLNAAAIWSELSVPYLAALL